MNVPHAILDFDIYGSGPKHLLTLHDCYVIDSAFFF